MTVLTCLLLALATVLWPSRSPGSGAPGRLGWTPPRGQVERAGGRAPPLAAFRTRWPVRQRDLAATEDVADALVLISLALRAGLPLVEALQHVQSGAVGRVRVELGAVVAALRWGCSAHEAWSYAGARWRAAALATHLAEQTGAAPSALIERAAGRLREERERERERAAARAGVLLVLPLGLGFLPAFACTAVVPVVLSLATGVLESGA
ncbi:type II secretion system F family protein [Pedococcus badiiscoriae]|nr:type II secretion system F family protein [Pedococcus badiiscoriae]